MKKLFALVYFIIFSLLICSSLNAQILGEGGWGIGEKQIRISASNPEHVQNLYNLKLNFDFSGPAYDYIIGYVTPSALAKIEILGIPYIAEVKD
ncbi:MAG: hypothetical protein WBG58_15375 [Ignavibacteriaceae bacterium]